eukprot:3830460-Rhodomonas_salina.3
MEGNFGLEQAKDLVLSADDLAVHRWMDDGNFRAVHPKLSEPCFCDSNFFASAWDPLLGTQQSTTDRLLRKSSDTRETIPACSSMHLLSPPQVWGQLVQRMSTKSDMATSETRHCTDPPLFV